MRLAFYVNVVSPHQLPLFEELASRAGRDSVFYIYAKREDSVHGGLWDAGSLPVGDGLRDCIMHVSDPRAGRLLETADVLLSGLRDFSLFDRRARLGLKNLYMSEAWFKPPLGALRLLDPRYFIMAWRMVRLLRRSSAFAYLPAGIHAARDMARLCGLMAGDLRCLFRSPELDFERKPGGKIFLASRNAKDEKKFALDKMRMWGYFVAPAEKNALPVKEAAKTKPPREIKVLWVGRLLDLKRVDAIVRAVGEHADLKRVDDSLPKITLDVYGTGPEEARLKSLAARYGDIVEFHPPVPIGDVRKLMREHDVYVLASNAYEGWGAVVSEALEEGMRVIGTYEAGSSATMLPENCLFHAGDWKKLAKLLAVPPPAAGIGPWTAAGAADALLAEASPGNRE